ncbi:MAG TPA: hypothetical protein VF480_12150 [Verrucomicrobiae bacterium]
MKNKCITAFVGILLLAKVVLRAAVLTITAAGPTPGTYDLCNFSGASMDVNNVHLPGNAPATNGPANDACTYVANDRATQGQTFTTGSGNGVRQTAPARPRPGRTAPGPAGG